MTKTIKQELSSFHFITILVILVVIGAFVLISSGMFDTQAVSNNQHVHTKNSATPSVDISAINEINKLEEQIKNNPNNFTVLLKLGHMLNDNGFHQRAIEKYEIYLKNDPKNADVIVDMGVCYFELKNYEKSISVIKDALLVDPQHQIAHFNLGIVNFANKNISEAKEWWKKASDLDPNTNIGKKAEELLKSN
jgi:cytochrome c-type biogenesis protein CcmH/NrfG